MAFVRSRRGTSVAGRSVAPATLGCTSCGGRCGMGDAAGDAQHATVETLQRQINRFNGAVLPVTGALDRATATAAVLVLMRRAADATLSGLDSGPTSANLLLQAGRALADPVPFVTANLPGVLEVVTRYADAKKLPRPGALPVAKKTLLIGAGILAGLLFMAR